MASESAHVESESGEHRQPVPTFPASVTGPPAAHCDVATVARRPAARPLRAAVPRPPPAAVPRRRCEGGLRCRRRSGRARGHDCRRAFAIGRLHERRQPWCRRAAGRSTRHDVGHVEKLGRGSGRVHVIDEGLGIPDDVLNRLFAPFDCLGADARRGGGAGLGLVLSRRFTDAMAGALELVGRVGVGPGPFAIGGWW